MQIRTCVPNQSTVIAAPPGYSSYVWNEGSTSNSIVISGAGVYSVTASDGVGCEGSDTIEVFLNIPDQVDLGSTKSGLGPIALDSRSAVCIIFMEYRCVCADSKCCFFW